MQGLDWQALPTVLEYLDAHDTDMIINGLLQLRDYHNRLAEARHGK